MDEDKTNQNSQEEEKPNTNDKDKEEENVSAIAPIIQIHGGCGLGAVTLIPNTTSKNEGAHSKIKKLLFRRILCVCVSSSKF